MRIALANMADKMGESKLLGVLFVILLLSQASVGRIHRLRLENDDRSQIDLSTFGFLEKGYLAVNLTDFSISPFPRDVKSMDAHTYGFTLDKTVSTGISPYLETTQESCILKKDPSIRNDNSVSVLFLRMDFANSRLVIDRKGNDLKDLAISLLTVEEFTNLRRSRRSTGLPSDVLSDTYLMRSRVRRDTAADKAVAALETKETNKTPTKVVSEANKTPTKDPLLGTAGKAAEDKKTASSSSAPPKNTALPPTTTSVASKKPTEEKAAKANETPKTENKNTTVVEKKDPTTETPAPSPINPLIDMKLVNASIPMKIKNGRISTYFLVQINSPKEEGLYNLFFHNCHNYLKDQVPTFVNLTVMITENNNGNFLSAGQMPLPLLYFTLSILYVFTGCYWFYVLRAAESGTVFKIHYLMLVLVFVKAIALLFHSINFYFIQKEGHHEEAFAILYYITHLMKGALLFITIVLIGAGWAFVKHILSDRDKKIFIIVIPLQVLANVAQIIIEETEEGQSEYTTWKEVFILVDLLCCGAILFPVVWSIRHLQEASGTDGKAAINLAKLKIFRHFYIMIVCYIYFTRIIVYLLKITVPFQYEWMDELFKELATFVFFIVTGYKFRPASNNPYLQVSGDSDDEIEMDEVVTKSGALDDVVRVNVKTKVGEPEENVGPSKRESSHDYD